MGEKRRHIRVFLLLILAVLIGSGGAWLHFQRLRQADASPPPSLPPGPSTPEPSNGDRGGAH